MDGKSIKKNILEELKKEVSLLEVKPKLVVIQVGNDDASNVYIKQKKKMAEYQNALEEMSSEAKQWNL